MVGAGLGAWLALMEPYCHQAEMVSVKASYQVSGDGDSHRAGSNWLSGGRRAVGLGWVCCPEGAHGQWAPGRAFMCALRGRLDPASAAGQGPQ